MNRLRVPFVIHWAGTPKPDLSGFIESVRVPFRFVPRQFPTSPDAQRVQEFLFTPRFPFFAEPPKGLVPRFMERIPRQSGKEAADNVPSWARGFRRIVGETLRQYAKRLMDEHYGPGKWEDTEREYNQIKKFGQRAFRDPKSEILVPSDDGPEA
jgi:hypothetical protein